MIQKAGRLVGRFYQKTIDGKDHLEGKIRLLRNNAIKVQIHFNKKRQSEKSPDWRAYYIYDKPTAAGRTRTSIGAFWHKQKKADESDCLIGSLTVFRVHRVRIGIFYNNKKSRATAPDWRAYLLSEKGEI